MASSMTASALHGSEDSPPRRRSIDSPTRRASANSSRGSTPSEVSGSTRVPAYLRLSRCIVDSAAFICLTTVWTVYALAGDDVRLITTNRPADSAFNALVMMCLAIFSVEIVVSCFGRSDYFFGFFFCLDILATVSLVLDLTWVADVAAKETAAAGQSDDNASNVRSGRTARLGARAGRVVRVLRLVRILKLYKTVHEASRKQAERQRKQKLLHPGAEDEWDETDIQKFKQSQEGPNLRESRVGKKLSEMTTRRVVCLILAMLLVLPALQTEEVDQLPSSASYGADHVSHAFEEYQAGNASRESYEEEFLRYVFYHNWFAGEDPQRYCILSTSSNTVRNSCSDAYYGHLFWVGITGLDPDVVANKTSAAAVSQPTVEAWAERAGRANDGIYNYGSMPSQAQALLHSTWNQDCSTSARSVKGLSLLRDTIDDVLDYSVTCPEDLRFQESIKFGPRLVTPQQYEIWHFTFIFDLRPYVRRDAQYNLLITLFVLVLLVVGSMMFAHDANTIVLRPVEKMMQRVEMIRDNPLIAMQMADDEFKAEEVAKALKRRKKRNLRKTIQKVLRDIVNCGSMKDGSELLETVILEKTIIKLGSLLALGFGEAGANIIAQNMSGADSAGVNAMIPGTCVSTIIGVARVRDFSAATEVLQSRINAFCNQIAEIVHGVCNEFHGAPNKNNGDMFLVIWRLEPEANRKEQGPSRAARLADMSVVAFATILGAVHQSPLLADYRAHPAMQNRLGTNNRVNLSFGLHAGWAIEGAVGSEFKIDASYLSPNVSVTMSIERATEAYGVSLMTTQSVVQLCTKRMVSKCRLIDRVEIAGSTMPMDLYCVDLDYMCLKVDTSILPVFTWNTRQRFKVRQFMDNEKSRILSEDIAAIFEDDPVISEMRSRYTNEFFQRYNMGFQNYSEGEWHVAQSILKKTKTLLGTEDGPSASLLRFMDVHDGEAPPNWRGVRAMAGDAVAGHAPSDQAAGRLLS